MAGSTKTVPSPSPSAAAKEQQSSDPNAWRRSSTKYFTIMYLSIFAVALVVHFATLQTERSELDLPSLVTTLEQHCPADSPDAQRVQPHLTANPPPAFFGVGMWVDSTSLLPAVHDVMDTIDARLTEGAIRAGQSSLFTNASDHMLYRFTRLQQQPDGTPFVSPEAAPFEEESSARAALVQMASQQQLGLPTLKHAFSPDVMREIRMLALSFFSIPTNRVPFVDVAQTPVQCATYEDGQAYCALFTRDDGTYVSSDVARDLHAAVASVLAHMLYLPSFQPEAVTRWHQDRSVLACLHAVRSVRRLEESMLTHPDMAIPDGVHSAYVALEQYVQHGNYVQAARGADDLSYHPLLTPQLYIPWDHSLVSQLTILLPIVSSTILAVRFLVYEKKVDRRRKRDAVEAAKPKAE